MIKIIKEKVGVLPIQIVKSNVSSVGPSSETFKTNARNVRLYYPYWQYTNLFILYDLYLYSANAAHYV